MALNITKTIAEIDDAFGGILHGIEVNANTGAVVAGATGINFGYVVGTQWEDKSDAKSFTDDTTENVKTVYRNRKVTLSTNLMQSGVNILSLPDELRNKNLRFYSCKDASATHKQHRIFAIGQPNPSFTVKQGDEKSPFSAECSPAQSDITISASALTGSLASGGLAISTTATSVTISAGKWYVDWEG